MIVTELKPSEQQYSVVVVGTGFGSLFFTHQLLQRRPDAQVLMLERGAFRSWEVQLADGRNSPIAADSTFAATGAHKRWNFTIAYGGGTNCWGGATPRMPPRATPSTRARPMVDQTSRGASHRGVITRTSSEVNRGSHR